MLRSPFPMYLALSIASFLLTDQTLHGQTPVTDAVSREITIFTLPVSSPPTQADAVSREFTLYTLEESPANLGPVDAIGREVTVFHLDTTPPPNLAVTSVISSGLSCGTTGGLLSGDTITVTYTVTNLGAGPTSGSWKDSVFFTSVQALSPSLSSENRLGTFDYIAPLAAGASYSRTVTVSLPEDLIGCRFIGVYADARPLGSFAVGDPYDVSETNEIDNSGFSAGFQIELAPQPDLVPQVPPLTLIAGSGQPFTVDVVIANAGAGPTDSGTWTDRVYLSQDTAPSISPGDLFLGQNTRSGAPLAGGAVDGSRPVTGTLPVVLTGTWNLKLVVDALAQVSEADTGGENNLFQLGTVNVIQLPGADITASIDALGTTTQWTPGHPATVTWNGSIASPLVVNVFQSWVDRVRLVGAPGGDRILAQRSQTTLIEPGTGDVLVASYLGNRTFIVPTDLPEGAYTLHVDLNVGNGLYEGSDDPLLDTAQIAVNVTFDPTNLIPAVNFDATPLPTSGFVGQPITLRWRVTNSGTRETAVSAWSDRVRIVGPGVDLALASVGHVGVLAAGASYIASAVAAIPPVSASTYSLVFRTDVSNVVFEQAPGEADNVVNAPFVVTADLSDLEIQVPPFFTPASATAGDLLQVTFGVQNSGTTPTNVAQWTDRVYLSTDTTLDGGDRFIGSRVRAGALAPLGTYSASGSFAIPTDLSGRHFVIVNTDSSAQVFEEDEANNIGVSATSIDIQALPLANLRVATVTAPSTGVSGQPLTIDWTVVNDGPGEPLPTSWIDSVYLSVDPVLDAGDLHLGAIGHGGGLLAGGNYGQTLVVTPPLSEAGTRFVFVKTDSSGVMPETDEGNNDLRAVGALELTLPDPGDLIVDAVVEPGSATIGLPATFQWTLENQDLGGTVATVSGVWSDAVFLSIDDTWSPDDVLLGESVGESVTVVPAQVVPRTGNFVYPPLLGPRHIVVRADSGGQIPEIDEENNLGGSLGTVEAFPTLLTAELPGDPPAGQIDQMTAGEFRAYQVAGLPAGETIEVELTHASPGAFTELLIRLGDLPTDDLFDATGDAPGTPHQVVRLPDIPGGDLYVLVRTFGTVTDPTFEVRARLLPLVVESATPESVGDVGRVTLDIFGANFDPGVTVQLENSTGTILTPRKLDRIDGCRLKAEFELASPPLGPYDLVATNLDLSTATGAGLVTIEPLIPPVLTIDFEEPPSFRAGGFATVEARVLNLGNVDAPYVSISERTPVVDTRSIVQLDTDAPFSLSFDEGTVLLSTALVRSLPPGAEVTLSTTYQLEGDPGTFIAQRGAALLDRAEWIQLQSDHAEALRLALIENPEQIPSEDFTALQPLLEDPILWRDAWFADLVTVGLLDPEDLIAVGVPPSPGAGAELCPETALVGSLADLLAAFEASPSGTAFGSLPSDELLVALEASSELLWDAGSCEEVEIRSAIDPNDKDEPNGVDESGWLGLKTPIAYVIHFENIVDPVFGAPASRVTVIDPLDANFNPASVRIGPFALNGIFYSVPSNRIFYQTTLELEEQEVFVQVTAGVDAQLAQVFWTFQSIDPATGLPPRSSTLGFLPPSLGTGTGTGAVSFDVQVNVSLAGSPPVDVPNGGDIIFDNNTPIPLDPVSNTIDPSAPSSELIAGLDALDERVLLDWSGQDGIDGSGLKDFDLYARTQGSSPGTTTLFAGPGGGTLEPLLLGTTATTFEYVGDPGVTYEFFLVARDRAGNVEPIVAPDAIITIPQNLPEISQDPVSQQVCEGTIASFTVGVIGTGPFQFQWRLEGAPIAGATDGTLDIDPVGLGDGGLYDVEVTNDGGTVTSGAALLTVLALPAISPDPVGGSFCPGDGVLLGVGATGASPLSYQWLRNGAPLAGENGAGLSIPSVVAGDEGTYSVEVSNGCGTLESAGAFVEVFEPPAISTEPTSQTVCPGGSASFSVTASGDPAPSYQWRRNGVAITGATANSLTLNGVSPADAGAYSVEATNACGSATSADAILAVLAAPTITLDPSGAALCLGDPLVLTSTALGDPTPSLQWTLDGLPIAGATAATYSVASVSLTDVGEYRLVATNVCGNATSLPASVTVDSPPTETMPISDASPCAGDTVVLTAHVTGSPPPTYQWSKDGLPISGATGLQLTLPAVVPGDAGNYCVDATNPCGTVTQCASVVVQLAPTVLAPPVPVTVCEGQVATFSVIADGAGPLFYQWNFEGTPIIGEEGEQLVLTAVLPAHAGNYSVTVTGACGSVTSTAAALDVLTFDLAVCDCNGNGVFDPTDIAMGTSLDLDGDGVPDECQDLFIRGDANVDGLHDVSDAIQVITFLFFSQQVPCVDALDINDSGGVDLGDTLFMILFLFVGGADPPSPFPDCGLDPTADPLECDTNTNCP